MLLKSEMTPRRPNYTTGGDYSLGRGGQEGVVKNKSGPWNNNTKIWHSAAGSWKMFCVMLTLLLNGCYCTGLYINVNRKSAALTMNELIGWTPYKCVIATFIIATFKNTLLVLVFFVFFDLLSVHSVLQSNEEKKNFYVLRYKNLPFRESKGTSKKT